MTRHPWILTSACVLLAAGAFAQQDRRESRDRERSSDTIPAGTRIPIRMDQTVDVRVPSDGRVFTGTVAEDVMSASGSNMIPRGARAELIVQNLEGNEATIDLESITFNNRRYMVDADRYGLSRKVGVGANSRTAKYVGGGALFGTIVGAIAGGGTGAAVGAAAGGAAGAGAQTIRRSDAIKVPAESVITFRLDEPLHLGVRPYDQDAGYDRDGGHYHDNYYQRDRDRSRQ